MIFWLIRELVFDDDFGFAASLCSAGYAEAANDTYLKQSVRLSLLSELYWIERGFISLPFLLFPD